MNGLAGNMQAQPRVFAHDADVVYTDGRVIWLDLDTLKGGTGYTVGSAVATSGTGVPAALTVDITSVDSDGKITGIAINAAGINGTDGSVADIAGGGGNASVKIRTTFPGSDERGACIYVGGSGAVEVLLEGGSTVIFAGVPSGAFLPILAKQVISTNTTATDMLALY
tara:strand:+ start:121 stop:624 length:504 start_codon:yes stop_codon:yes gene_type:complete